MTDTKDLIARLRANERYASWSAGAADKIEELQADVAGLHALLQAQAISDAPVFDREDAA